MRNMANEIILKASLYNLLTTLAITPNTRRKSLKERTRQEPVMRHNTHEGNLIFEANSLTTWFFKWNL
jgi:CTP-dependent riboflavin kinase